MARTWVTADHHFGHGSIVENAKRPFSSVEEMDQAMIERHNARVTSNDDDVFMLGDFSGSKDKKYLEHIFRRLRGRKHLITGNHDTNAVCQLPWSSHVREQRIIKVDGMRFVLAHHFRASWDRLYDGAFHLYGHTHGRMVARGKSIDVGVDAWGYEPITLAEAVYAMKKFNSDYHTYVPEQTAVQRFRVHEADRALIRDDGLNGRDYLAENLRIEADMENGVEDVYATLNIRR